VNRLDLLHRRALYAVCVVLFITGCAWAVLHYLHAHLGLGEQASMAQAVLAMKVHGAAAMLALVLIGTVLPRHVNHGLRNARNKPSGIGMLCVLALLSVSGYFLYYAGSEEFRSFNSWAHLAAGLALPAVGLAHVVRRLPGARAALVAESAR
jgi:Kef-type K+ transport system membrane component KefB